MSGRVATPGTAPHRPAWLTVPGWLTVGLYLLVGVVALLPRVLDQGSFPDSDEVNFWLGRSQEFLQALQAGRPADTAISTHPGVTTMWLGSAGVLLRRALLDWGVVDGLPFPTLLALTRLPLVLVHGAGVVVGYALLRRLLPLQIATLAALLWAADPFLVAYQRILHVDGLAATFTALCLLAACGFWHGTRRPGLLVLSGVCGGLAVLSKSPGLIVVPVVGLIALWGAWRAEAGSTEAGHAEARRWGAPLLQLLIWGGAAGATLVLVWPAVWADPLRVYELLQIGVEVEGGSPHVVGNFFLGQATETPDVRFYPTVLALRTTPLTLTGLLALALLWPRAAQDASTPRRSLAVLALTVLLFVAAMSLFPKKLNRYLVPIFPLVDVLAAVGLAWALDWLARLWERSAGVGGRPVVVRWAVGVLALVAVANMAWWHPYGVAAFNQVLGGTPAGARTLLLGEGEGLGQVADWLHQQPNITGVTVASTMIQSLQPYLHRGVQAVSPRGELAANTGYVVVYLRHTQRGPLWPPFDQFYPRQQPAHTVTIHGTAYAWLYEVPPPIAQRLTAQFGPAVLRGYAIDATALRATGTLSLTLQWQTAEPIGTDHLIFAHLLDASGQRVGQTDAPPAGPQAPTSSWQPGRTYHWVHPLPVAADLSPGRYWLALGLYDPATFARLPLRESADLPATPDPDRPDKPDRPDRPDAGGNALVIPITLPD